MIVESLAICTLVAYEVDGEVGLPYPYLIPKVSTLYWPSPNEVSSTLGLSR